MSVAKVPIRPEMAEALTLTAADATPGEVPSSEEIPHQIRGLLDDLGRSADDSFMVVEGLAETGTLMPAELGAYLTHELGLSPHSVLREAVPLLLLDPEPLVRQAAAAVLEQAASRETISPVMLRRTLLVRNWVPEAEREAIDRLVRKARLKGVVCAQWAPPPALAIHASMVDGSGTQSVILTSPTGRTGLFAGLLLKAGFGLRDAWCDVAVSRRDITKAVKEVQRQTASHAVGRDFLHTAVQHSIARVLAAGHLPQTSVVAIAEAIGAADWKDRGLDVAAETERLFDGLDAALRSPAAIAASLPRSGTWLADDPAMQSWFDDDAAIRALVECRPRPKPDVAVRRVLDEVLPGGGMRGPNGCCCWCYGCRPAAARRCPPAGGRIAWCWGMRCWPGAHSRTCLGWWRSPNAASSPRAPGPGDPGPGMRAGRSRSDFGRTGWMAVARIWTACGFRRANSAPSSFRQAVGIRTLVTNQRRYHHKYQWVKLGDKIAHPAL